MSPTITRKLGVFGWLVLTLVCVVYAPMAIEYSSHFFVVDSPKLWMGFFSWATSETHALGPGSVELVQREIYTTARLQMLIHTIGGGLAILLSCLQFSSRFRRHYPAWHRVLGRLQVAIVLTSTLGAMAYLIHAGAANTYNGAIFNMQLWMLAVGTVLATTLAVAAILRGQVRMHNSLMAYQFAMLLSAPILRILWVIMANLNPGMTQEVTNLASVLIYAVFIVPATAVALRVMDDRPTNGTPSSHFLGSRLQSAIWGTGLLFAAATAMAYLNLVGPFTWMHSLLLGLVLTTLGLYGAAYLVASRNQHAIARYEWQVHLAALGASPVLTLLIWIAASSAYPMDVSFWGAAGTGPTIAMSLGLFFVVWSRRHVGHEKEKTIVRDQPRAAF